MSDHKFMIVYQDGLYWNDLSEINSDESVFETYNGAVDAIKRYRRQYFRLELKIVEVDIQFLED